MEITIFDESASNSEKLKIRIANNTFSLCYNKAYITQAEIQKINFRKATLTISQANFKKGNLLQGKMEATFVEKLTENSKKIRLKKYVFGTFEVWIE